MTTATRHAHDTTTERVLFVALALTENTRRLGCTAGRGQRPRERRTAACHQARLLHEVARATERFGLPATAPVVHVPAVAAEDQRHLHRALGTLQWQWLRWRMPFSRLVRCGTMDGPHLSMPTTIERGL